MSAQWGASGAISDITPAAGWQILSCDPNGMDQDIRLVCMHDDASCDHLLEGGAENTIVRLPESVRSPSLPPIPHASLLCAIVL